MLVDEGGELFDDVQIAQEHRFQVAERREQGRAQGVDRLQREGTGGQGLDQGIFQVAVGSGRVGLPQDLARPLAGIGNEALGLA